MKKIYFVKADLADEYPVFSNSYEQAILEYIKEIFDVTIPSDLNIEESDKNDYHFILQTEDLSTTKYFKINKHLIFFDKEDSYFLLDDLSNDTISNIFNKRLKLVDDFTGISAHMPLTKRIYGVEDENK